VDGVTARPSTRKARALMTFLIMNQGKEAARERLMEAFWPDADPECARNSLSTALWSVRRCIQTAGLPPDSCLVATRSIVQWTAPTVSDATRFEELASLDEPEANREALKLYRGDFLEGDYDSWTVAERERLASLYEGVLSRVLQSSKNPDVAQRLIARNPYDEDAYAAIVESELATGRRAAAAAWVERCRRALAEIGEHPSTAFESRFGNILYNEPIVASEISLPFAGRNSELGRLTTLMTDLSSGRGSVALIHGEAGIGKSSLMQRFARLAEQKGVGVLRVLCSSDATDPFGPWRCVFETLGAGDWDALVKASGGEVASAVTHAIAASLSTPTAILVDDAHELRGDALDICRALARTAATRYMVAMFMRPEGVARMREQLSDVDCDDIVLGRLERADLQWALAQALNSDRPDVFDALYSRSAGHPLFFEGLLRSLVDQGTLARDGREWRLAGSVDESIDVPDTVRLFIEKQLQSRGETPRTVACALALEPTATADDLVAVLGFSQPAVFDALDDLLALGVITQPSSGSVFAFVHDLIREVAAVALNVGRRTALHRAFADRLVSSSDLHAPQRLARHYQAAGEPLASAQSFLRSAEIALDLNAAQDALDRCEAGIAQARTLARSASGSLVLAKLRRLSARAAMATGNVQDAIRLAREAISASSASRDIEESAKALLDLAVLEGIALRAGEQAADAAEAERTAKELGNQKLLALALLQTANASRRLCHREKSVEAATNALALSQQLLEPELSIAALNEMSLVYATWWDFGEALKSARAGLNSIHRVSPSIESRFRQSLCLLWYLLDRFEDAGSELHARFGEESTSIERRQINDDVSYLASVFAFMHHYLAAKVANERKQWDEALVAVHNAASVAGIGKLPGYAQALSLLRIDILLQRNAPEDASLVHSLIATVDNDPGRLTLVGWTDCEALVRARCAARGRASDAFGLLYGALNVLEEAAHRAPLDVDRAFARLAGSAAEIGDARLTSAARERAEHYRHRRQSAAGSHWAAGDRRLALAHL